MRNWPGNIHRRVEERSADAQPRHHPRDPSPDLLRRHAAGGLRLPRPHARAQEHQEDRAVRRRAARLPPVLRQPGGRREHGPDELPVPPRGLDGQARHEPAQADQPVRAGGLDRLLGGPAGGAGLETSRGELFGTERLYFSHPCGIPYAMVGETEPDDREPWDDGGVPGEHAIRGAYGTTTSVREPEPMDFFLREAFNCALVASEGGNHQYERRPAATGASSSWSRSPTSRRARGTSARARSTTTPSTPARPRTRRRSRTTSSGSGSPT